MVSRFRLRVKKSKMGNKQPLASDRSSGTPSNCPSLGQGGGHSSFQHEYEDDVFAAAHGRAGTLPASTSNAGGHKAMNQNETPKVQLYSPRRLVAVHSNRLPSSPRSFVRPRPAAHTQPPSPTMQSLWPLLSTSRRLSFSKKEGASPDTQQLLYGTSTFNQFADNHVAFHRAPPRSGLAGQSPQRGISTSGSGQFPDRTDHSALQQDQQGRERQADITHRLSRRELPASPQVYCYNPLAVQQSPFDDGQSSFIVHSPTDAGQGDQSLAELSSGYANSRFLSATSSRWQNPRGYGQPSLSAASSWRQVPQVYEERHNSTACPLKQPRLLIPPSLHDDIPVPRTDLNTNIAPVQSPTSAAPPFAPFAQLPRATATDPSLVPSRQLSGIELREQPECSTPVQRKDHLNPTVVVHSQHSPVQGEGDRAQCRHRSASSSAVSQRMMGSSHPILPPPLFIVRPGVSSPAPITASTRFRFGRRRANTSPSSRFPSASNVALVRDLVPPLPAEPAGRLRKQLVEPANNHDLIVPRRERYKPRKKISLTLFNKKKDKDLGQETKERDDEPW